MVVPYGDPTPLQSRKNAFDAGEYNIGALANSLTLGCDCLGEIHYFDAHLCDSRGEPMTIEHAICLHEEDAGMLWKHTDFRTGQVEVRRSRRLVISSISTVANYEYAFYWMLYQDGRIEFEIKLTGIVSTATRPDGADASYGQRLNGDGLYAPIHEHLFNVRLDLDVDGEDNAIYEIDTEATPPGSENPFGNAFRAVPRLLESEIGARRDVDPSRSRHWLVVNRERRNRVGEPVGYRLIPSGSVPRYSQDDAFVSQRAGFTAHHLWVTPYDPQQLHAAGDYPNQSRGGDGLPAWTREDRPLVDRDVVLWYTLGSNHIVRLEDWPLTPAKAIGFMLEPCGFFDETPALDVPPEPAAHCSRSNGDA
jgi:primary-amine oxidase